jgi:hypothetical protein
MRDLSYLEGKHVIDPMIEIGKTIFAEILVFLKILLLREIASFYQGLLQRCIWDE